MSDGKTEASEIKPPTYDPPAYGNIVGYGCPHGTYPLHHCGQCAEDKRKERFEEASMEVFTRLIAVLERLEKKL